MIICCFMIYFFFVICFFSEFFRMIFCERVNVDWYLVRGLVDGIVFFGWY